MALSQYPKHYTKRESLRDTAFGSCFRAKREGTPADDAPFGLALRKIFGRATTAANAAVMPTRKDFREFKELTGRWLVCIESVGVKVTLFK